MKNYKILSWILSTAIIFGTISPVQALGVSNSTGSVKEDITNETVIGQDTAQVQKSEYNEAIAGNNTTNIYATIASIFDVTIPKTLILDGQTKTGQYSVKIEGDIAGEETILVIPDETFAMKQSGKDNVTASIEQDKTDWTYNQFDTLGIGTVTADGLTAGSWNGSFNFNISKNLMAGAQVPMSNINIVDENGINLNGIGIVMDLNDPIIEELNNDNIVKALNITCNEFEGKATATIDVSDFAKDGELVNVYHYDEELNKWEYITTATVANGKIIAEFDSFSPVAFVMADEVHTHNYQESITKEATCVEEGIRTFKCTCGDSYTETINIIEHDCENGICKMCGEKIEYIEFELTADNYQMAGIVREGNVIIPKTFKYDNVYYKTTSIGEWAFAGCDEVTSITLPETINKIGSYAFQDCSLTNINIPENVTVINEGTFTGCYELREIIIPEGVTTIGMHAFASCGINKIVLPNTLKTIEDSAFTGSSLKSITIPNSVTEMGEYVFNDCYELINVKLSENMTSIKSNTFLNCHQLTSVDIPDGITNINSSAFMGCYVLENITIPDSVTIIENSAFMGCDQLINVKMSKNIETIGEYAFAYTNIFGVNIPSTVQTVGQDAFCEVPLIYYEGPLDTYSWGALNINNYGMYDGNFTSWEELINNGYIVVENDEIIQGYADGKLIIPAGIKKIGSYAFGGSSIECLILPNTIEEISEGAFSSCMDLKEVTLSEGIKTIGYSAFENCNKLTSIEIPNSVTSIDYQAFYGIKNVIYNGTAEGAPWGAACINGYIENDILYNNDKTILYKYVGNDTGNNLSIDIPNTVITISDNAFEYCTNLINVTIPNSVTTIGNYAFSSTGIDNLEVPSSVTEIGDKAFNNIFRVSYDGPATGSPWGATCVNGYIENDALYNSDKTILYEYMGSETNFVIPDGVETINERAFQNCKTLTSITIPDSVSEIGKYAFNNCINLKEVTLPTNITTIENYTFEGCTNLEKVIIPNNVTIIGTCAFDGCEKLTNVNIPNSVVNIKSYAFYDCTSLTDITIPDNVTTIGNKAFYKVPHITYNGTATGSPWGALSIN